MRSRLCIGFGLLAAVFVGVASAKDKDDAELTPIKGAIELGGPLAGKKKGEAFNISGSPACLPKMASRAHPSS